MYYNDLLSALVSYALGRASDQGLVSDVHVERSEVAMNLLRKQRERKLPRRTLTRKSLAISSSAAVAAPPEEGTLLTIDMIVATIVIQSWVRVVFNR